MTIHAERAPYPATSAPGGQESDGGASSVVESASIRLERDPTSIAALLLLLVCAVGLALRALVVSAGLAEPLPASLNVFYRLYGLHEATPLLLLGAFALVAWIATTSRVHWPRIAG
jgi:hypothetical protein